MIGILFGAWLFCMASFCVVGVGCRIACRGRRSRGLACVCGRHEGRSTLLRGGPALATGGLIAGGSSRLGSVEAKVRSLQQWYVEGRLSMEQYEVELDRVVGIA